jgi:hypothetical protein
MRRLVALIALLAAVYVAVNHANFGMLRPVFALLAVLVAILATAVLIFNLPLRKPGPPQDSGFGMSEPVGIGIGSAGLLLFAVIPLVVAARGLYRGAMPALGSGPDVALSQSPAQFLLLFAMWVAIGLAVLWLLRKALISRRAQSMKPQSPHLMPNPSVKGTSRKRAAPYVER